MQDFFVKPAVHWAIKFVLPLTSIALVIIFGLAFFVSAAPTQFPPSGNLPYPLNNSSVAQTKKGSLDLLSSLNASSLTSTQTNATTVCVSGDCVSAWPSASYTTPSLAQVVTAGNYSTGLLYMYDNFGGFNFNGTNRSEWYTGRLYYGTQYNTGSQCSPGYVIRNITWPNWNCAQVLVQTW